MSVQDPLVNDPTVTDYDYNAFLTTAPANRPTGPNDVLVSAFNWQSGPSGDFYLPAGSSLIDAGSASAGAIGLYHHTTQTNQTKEGASRIDIGFHSLAANQNGLPLDSDGDGIPDYIEDLDGDGLVDSGETDWGNADTDYDGITDYDELEGQTDPLDPDSFTSVQLAHFKFDAPNWAGEESQLPRAAHNVDQPDTWSGKGVQITSRQYSYLAYKDHEANGQPNINLRRGTVRFWFKPDWSSTTAGGTGPQTWARLVEMGRYDPTWGRWVIGLHPNGTSLEFSATAASGSPAQTMLLHPISWTVGQWHQIAVTYGPEGSVLYIDGVPVRSGSGVQHWPSLAQRQALGLMIGNDGHISQPAKGTFEELETFNYQLTEPEIWAGFSDGDELPDIWEYSHFGSLGQDGSGDYDNDGTTNLDEYLAETNPNTIAFSLTVTNSYVGTSLTALQLKIDHGIPFKYAVLVDPTNTELAEWSPCTSLDVPVNLGSVEGWHEVWVGLRGHPETSEQIWERKNVKLDLTPPMLVITSPESTLVSQPMIQLTGYSAEPLSSISCTVSNAAGIFANQMIYVLRQHYDTNSHELTTNTFQAFDLELTNGLNTITLSAADLAGNLTTPNVDFTVVNDTEAPVVSLYWPQNGAILCGETFTWRGGVDDFTASVTISTSDSGGQTSEIIALVERDGRFWAEEIPLFAGANFLTLTATDAWGNQASTNIQVVKSEIGLTIDSVTSDLNEPRVTVTGAIVSAGYSVWVNGVKATDNGGGAWTAEYVPLPRGGTPVIQARAIPNTDNGGNGTGGGGGTSSSYEEPGNPASAQAQDAEAQPEGQQGICLESDSVAFTSIDREMVQTIDGEWWEHTFSFLYNHDWLEGYGGGGTETKTTETWRELFSGSSHTFCELKTAYEWPVELSLPGYRRATADGNDPISCSGYFYEAGEGPTQPISICWQYCWKAETNITEDINDLRIKTLELRQYRRAQTTLLLRTGGKKIPGRQSLWVITGNVGEPSYLDWQPCSPHYPVPLLPIPHEKVTIGALGTLGSDGRLYVALPDGEELSATPVVKGVDYYVFNPSGTKHKLLISANDTALDAVKTNAEFCVGQKVTFTAGWDFTPPGISSNVYDWVMSRKYVNHSWQNYLLDEFGDKIYYGSVNYDRDDAVLKLASPWAWWVSGGIKNVGLNITVHFDNGQNVKMREKGRFGMFRPTITLAPPDPGQLSPYYKIIWENLDVCKIKLGEDDGSGDGTLKFGINVFSTQEGYAGITQLITAHYSNPAYLFSEERCDGAEFYSNPIYINARPVGKLSGAVFLDDGPSGIWVSPNIVHLCARDFVRFKPGGMVTNTENIWVTIGLVTWETVGIAEHDPNDPPPFGSWSITADATDGPNGPVDTDEFPNWTINQGGMH